jgi:hypothetical protein
MTVEYENGDSSVPRTDGIYLRTYITYYILLFLLHHGKQIRDMQALEEHTTVL